ncbi:MAG: DUF2752 domain-containing protein [Candidatus Nanopelagicales bacterium]
MTIQLEKRDTAPNGALGRLGIRIARESFDGMPKLIWFVAIGVVLAAGFAVFGLPGYQLPMPTWHFGVVTPTCGLTRASTALARGEIATAWSFNPAAFVLALVAVGAVARSVVGYLTHRWVNVTMKPTRLGWVVIVALVLLWWGNQQLNAHLIMTGSI